MHNKTVSEVLQFYKITEETGLSEDNMNEARKKYGFNELPSEKKKSLILFIFQQFDDLMAQILLVSVLISFTLPFFEDADDTRFSLIEALVILILLIANIIIGVFQERMAKSTITSLKECKSHNAKVIRFNQKNIQTINARELVPGDLVELSAGDIIPADIRITSIRSATLTVDQSMLTGESMTVRKQTESILDIQADNQEKKNILFNGTYIISGKCRGIVTSIGKETELWKIRDQVGLSQADKTHVQQKLDEFGNKLTMVIFSMGAAVWIVNIGRFNDSAYGGSWGYGAIHYLKIVLALAVAAIPQSLPVIVTTVLTCGIQKMSEGNVTIRSLKAIEKLGCVNVICSDKTGGFTSNEMTVSRLFILSKSVENEISALHFDVTGSNYAPKGEIILEGKSILSSDYDGLVELCNICVMCNHSGVHFNNTTEAYERVGDATDASLICLVEKLNPDNIDKQNISQSDLAMCCNYNIQSKWQKKFTLEFTEDRKSMSVFVEPTLSMDFQKDKKMFVKGSIENILERCTYVRVVGKTHKLTENIKEKILGYILSYSTGRDMLKCVALATVDDPIDPEKVDLTNAANFSHYERNMTFVGVIGMFDPPRMEVHNNIEKCRQAGIRVIVMTEDNKSIGEAICRRIGIFDEMEATIGKSFTGKEFEELTPEMQIIASGKARLFSLVESSNRKNIIQNFQCSGHIVATIGNCVNDVPALKIADLSVAMEGGTDVAKDTSDIILADDNFNTLVYAIEESRAIYKNLQQCIRHFISSNIGAVVSIFLTVAFGMPEVLIPSQLVWINLITNRLPVTAFGFNPPDHDVMKKKSRQASDRLIGNWLLVRTIITGLYIGCATVISIAWWFMIYSEGPQINYYQLTHQAQCLAQDQIFDGMDCGIFLHPKPMSIALSVLVVSELLNALNSFSVSENQSLIVNQPWRNIWILAAICTSFGFHFVITETKILAKLFRITSLSFSEWIFVIKISIPILIIDETMKFMSRKLWDDEPFLKGIWKLILIWAGYFTTIVLCQ